MPRRCDVDQAPRGPLARRTHLTGLGARSARTEHTAEVRPLWGAVSYRARELNPDGGFPPAVFKLPGRVPSSAILYSAPTIFSRLVPPWPAPLLVPLLVPLSTSQRALPAPDGTLRPDRRWPCRRLSSGLLDRWRRTPQVPLFATLERLLPPLAITAEVEPRDGIEPSTCALPRCWPENRRFRIQNRPHTAHGPTYFRSLGKD